uniref:Uncharacterized protein n=1 Tax=Crocodylus porosus TaxID=8502 RepID=A0A7M4FCR6_CROPO
MVVSAPRPAPASLRWVLSFSPLTAVPESAGGEAGLIYWGCFYFFPWLRTWRRGKREQSAEPSRSAWHRGLSPAAQRDPQMHPPEKAQPRPPRLLRLGPQHRLRSLSSC